MHDPIGIPHQLHPHSRLERRLDRLTRALAVLGGAVFIALIAMSLVSIIGRKLNLVTVTGDIELMQAGTAIAVSLFLPYCTLLGEHLKVEFFTERMAPARRAVLDAMGETLLMVAFGLITWRTALQVHEMTDTGEVTPLLSIPMWWLVAGIVPGLAFTTLCAGFRAVAALRSSRKAPHKTPHKTPLTGKERQV